jgi:undecaprenyl-diphosphatase
MDWLDALIMGVVQGLAEYLPISSSGHLEICRSILHLDLDPDKALTFSLMLHVATVLSTLVVLWREFWPLCTSFFTLRRDDNSTYVWKILLSCIPVGIVGVLFKDTVEQFFGTGLTVVGWCLMVTALLLAFAYFSGRRAGHSAPDSGRDISWTDALIIGVAQAIAVLPGLSRSGCTIATGILLGNKRSAVAQFSFFMVIIPILGEGLLDLKDMLSADAATESVGLLPLAVGFIAAFVVGCLSCRWMIDIVKRGKLVWFALYCLAAGLLCVLW